MFPDGYFPKAYLHWPTYYWPLYYSPYASALSRFDFGMVYDKFVLDDRPMFTLKDKLKSFVLKG